MKFSLQRVTRQIEFPDASARAWEDVCTQDVCADPGDRSSLLLLWGGTPLPSYVGGVTHCGCISRSGEIIDPAVLTPVHL